MAMNRVQFQQGMSLFELFQQFGTEAQCEAALEHARWPQGFRCPRCGGTAHCILGVRARKTFQCNTCRHQTSLIACQPVRYTGGTPRSFPNVHQSAVLCAMLLFVWDFCCAYKCATVRAIS